MRRCLKRTMDTKSSRRPALSGRPGLADTSASDQNLAISIDNLNRAAERRAAEERDNKQREMHDLLTFVQGQIHGERQRTA